MPAKKNSTKKTTAVRKTTAPVSISKKPKSLEKEIASIEIRPTAISPIVAAKPAEIKSTEIKAPNTIASDSKAPQNKAPEIKPTEVKVSEHKAAQPAISDPKVSESKRDVPVSAAAISPAVAPEIIEAISHLRHPVAQSAVEAAERLAASADAAALMPLIETLRNDDGYFHIVTRAAAAMALGRFNDSRSIIALTVAATDAAAEVSTEAILSLGQLKAADATDLLIDIADNASGFYLLVTRHAAIRALGLIGATRAIGLLNDIAASQNEEYSIVIAARDALSMM